jgi:formiminotetrahydrofolate cyclodeaminase
MALADDAAAFDAVMASVAMPRGTTRAVMSRAAATTRDTPSTNRLSEIVLSENA